MHETEATNKTNKMELKKDFKKNEKKSAFRIIVGILLLVLSVIWISGRIIDNMMIRPFDWLVAASLALNGVIHTIEGQGIPLARLFGKAYILVNNEQIVIKLKNHFVVLLHCILYIFNMPK